MCRIRGTNYAVDRIVHATLACVLPASVVPEEAAIMWNQMHRFAALAALTAVSACATTVPAERMASAQAAIRAANEVGADRTPTAALHLQYAREEFSQAQQLSARGESDRARALLARSEADAELSLALAREAGSRSDVRAAEAQATATPQQTQPTQGLR